MNAILRPGIDPGGSDEQRKCTPVLFIACAGRSGSTLLDRIIGMHEGFFSAGELRFIWERSFHENQLCGCGATFERCEFWRRVSCEAFGMEIADIDASGAVCLRESLDENRYAPWLIQSRSPACYRAALLVYGRLLERLYAHILQVSGDNVVVDSSGDATHGLILSRLSGIELHVVHLVRDPRAVAFSWTRMRERPEIHWTAEHIPIERPQTSATRWVLHNSLAERLAKPAASYRRVQYEEFVADPGLVVSEIMAPFDWAAQEPTIVTDGEVVLRPSHTVSGNPMRFRHGQMKIKLDDEWRKAMPARDRRLVTAITWPLLAKYGYRVSSNG